MSSESYRRSNEAIFSEVGGDVVALHLSRGQCYGMENVTAAVWRLLENPSDLDDICSRLMEDYDVAPEMCRAQVVTLLKQMQKEGLVQSVN